MAYAKKVWKDRQTEYPTRRRLSPTGTEDVYDVSRDEGLVIEEGDAFSAANMNDLEDRVASIRPKTSALILTAAGWAASGENFVQTVQVSGVTGDTFVTLLPTAAQAAQMLEDGTAALIPESGTGTVSVTSVGAAPTVDMTLEILLQEVNAE